MLKLDPKSTEALTRKQAALSNAVIDTKDKLDALKMTQQKIDDGSMTATEEQYRDLQREIDRTEVKLKQLSEEQRRFASVSGVQLQAVGKEFQQMGQRMSATGKSLLPLTLAIGAVGAAALKSSIDFESSFAGVRKTVNATEQELGKLANASREAALEKPVDVNDINHIMELGGQLGIATDQLDRFAGVIGDLDVATDMDIESASLQLAQFTNICGTSQSDIDRLGATIVGLGNNSATTESAIMDMAMRIAGSATQVGMSEAQILGLAASLSSVGITAEAGGSAISQVMSKIDSDVAKGGDTLDTWAATAGMTTQQFKRAWETDAAGAMQSLIGGMENAVESGGNVNLILDELGITALRQTDTLKRLTSASELMGTTMGVANTSWRENTALTNEANQRYATTESRLKMMANQINDVGISIGNGLKSALASLMDVFRPFLSGVQEAARAFEQADPGIQMMIVSSAGLVAALAPLLIVSGKITEGLGTMMIALGESAVALSAKAAAATGDTAATIANTAASNANTVATNAGIIKNTIKEALDARLAIQTAAKTAATTADTVATGANAAATEAVGIAAAGASIKTIALSVASKAQAIAAGIATVAQIAWNAAMTANPIGVIIMAVAALVAIIGALAVAITSNIQSQERLTVSSENQKNKVDELQAAYDDAAAAQGEHSDAAVQAKYALDEERASFEASKETIGEFRDRCSETIGSHEELITSLQDSGREADTQAGKMLYLADQVGTLSASEGKSAEDKAKLAAMTEQLNASCEGLNLVYDRQTDSLNMSIDALKQAAQAEADRARAQAAMDTYSDLLSDQVELEMQLAEAQANCDAETQKNIDSWGMLGDVQTFTSQEQADLEQTVRDTQEALDENSAAQKKALEVAARYSTKESVLALAMEEVKDGTLSAEDAAAKYSSTVEGGITADDIRAKQAHEAAMAEQELAEATNSTMTAIESYADAHDGFRNALSASGLSVSEFADILVAQDVDFDEAAQAIEEYSSRAASGFDRIADSSSNTIGALYETLAYNLEATQNWSANLEAVFGRTGVSFSQEFVDAVKEGGVEEYGTVMAQLKDMSDEDLQAISDAYAANGQAGVESYLNEQRLLVPGTKEALSGTEGAVSDALAPGQQAADQSGAATGSAYTESLKASIATCPQDVQGYIAQLQGNLAASADPAGLSGGRAGTNYSSNLEAAISGCPAEVQAHITDMESRLTLFELRAAMLGTSSGTNFGANTASSMGGQVGAVSNSAGSLRQAIQGQLDSMPLYSATKGTEAGSSLSGGLSGQSGSVNSAAWSLKSSAEGPLGSIDGNAYGWSAGSGFGNGIGSTAWIASGSAATIASCCDIWKQVGGWALGWGYDAAAGFASGLSSAMWRVIDAATSVAGAISSILHFSVPDVGPLSDADEYGPDFMNLLAGGMRSGLRQVKDVAGEVAQAMSIDVGEMVSGQVQTDNLFESSTGSIPVIAQQAAARAAIPQALTTATTYNIYVDDVKINDDVAIRACTTQFLETLLRKGVM